LLDSAVEHSLARAGSTLAARGQHCASAAHAPDGLPPLLPPLLVVPPPSPPPELLEPLAGPPVQGDSQLCVSHAKTGPSQDMQEPVMHAWSCVRHMLSRQLTQAVE
jgi:hypothetical protein